MCHLGKFLGRAFEIPKGLHGEAFFAAVTLKVVAAPAVSWNSISHKIWYYWTPCHLILTTCLLCNLCLAPTIRMLRWGLTLETHPSSTYHRYNYMCTFWATLNWTWPLTPTQGYTALAKAQELVPFQGVYHSGRRRSNTLLCACTSLVHCSWFDLLCVNLYMASSSPCSQWQTETQSNGPHHWGTCVQW